MMIWTQVHRGFAQRAYLIVRWLVREFLWMTFVREASSIVTLLGRVLGLLMIAGVMRVCLSHGMPTGALARTMQCVLAGVLATLLGNTAREIAIDLGARLLGWFGVEYSRSGVRIDGKAYHETLYPDGTWYRCVSDENGAVCEWTDEFGGCYQSATARSEVLPD